MPSIRQRDSTYQTCSAFREPLLSHHTLRWSSICGILGRVASAAVPSSIAGPYYAISHLAMASLVMACSSFVLSVLYLMFDDTSLTRISRQCRRDRDLLE